MKSVIIGSGLQARRRGQAILDSKDDVLVGLFSDNQETASSLSKVFGCRNFNTASEMLEIEDVDSVIVCTPPNSHFQYVKLALEAKKHVLVEKPFTQNSEQSSVLLELAKNAETIVRCGFNHRFHPALLKLKEIIHIGELGPIKFTRSLYGIGLRDEYREEWRANPKVAAGGQFMEQGSHLVDLMQFLVGDVCSIFLKPMNFILPNIHGEDSGLALLTHENGAVSNITSTLLQWHNRFTVEIFGEYGFATIEGLGGSYGIETLKIGMNLPGQPFTSEIIEFRGGDQSWLKEWDAFKLSCEGNQTVCATPEQAHQVMRVIEAGYKSAQIMAEVNC
jgi:predicted dehydrogenase